MRDNVLHLSVEHRVRDMADKEAVSEEGLVRYVETFLGQYRVAVEAMVEPEVRGRLLRYSYLPSRVIAYVSSFAGVAISYVAECEERRSKTYAKK
jgi:hypothetical protein